MWSVMWLCYDLCWFGGLLMIALLLVFGWCFDICLSGYAVCLRLWFAVFSFSYGFAIGYCLCDNCHAFDFCGIVLVLCRFGIWCLVVGFSLPFVFYNSVAIYVLFVMLRLLFYLFWLGLLLFMILYLFACLFGYVFSSCFVCCLIVCLWFVVWVTGLVFWWLIGFSFVCVCLFVSYCGWLGLVFVLCLCVCFWCGILIGYAYLVGLLDILIIDIIVYLLFDGFAFVFWFICGFRLFVCLLTRVACGLLGVILRWLCYGVEWLGGWFDCCGLVSIRLSGLFVFLLGLVVASWFNVAGLLVILDMVC